MGKENPSCRQYPGRHRGMDSGVSGNTTGRRKGPSASERLSGPGRRNRSGACTSKAKVGKSQRKTHLQPQWGFKCSSGTDRIRRSKKSAPRVGAYLKETQSLCQRHLHLCPQQRDSPQPRHGSSLGARGQTNG